VDVHDRRRAANRPEPYFLLDRDWRYPFHRAAP